MISIVIPAYNNRDKLFKLLDSLKQAGIKKMETEVIVVDDCSTVDLSAGIKQGFDFVRVISLKKRSGPATARNIGAENSQGDILLFLDSDVIVKKDTLLKVKQAFGSNSVTALEGEYDIIPANPGFLPRFKALECRSFVRDQRFITIFGPRIGAINKYIFLEMGGFSSLYKTASVEDYEFSDRLHKKGHLIHYDKTLEVKHHFTEKLTKQLTISFHRSDLWAQLFVNRKKFDNFGSTFEEGVGRLSGFIFTLSLPLLFLSGNFVLLTVILFLLYLVLNKHFFVLVARKEGVLFLLKSIVAHLLISLSITAGFMCGISKMFFRNRVHILTH